MLGGLFVTVSERECPKCRQKLVRISENDEATYFCPNCKKQVTFSSGTSSSGPVAAMSGDSVKFETKSN